MITRMTSKLELLNEKWGETENTGLSEQSTKRLNDFYLSRQSQGDGA